MTRPCKQCGDMFEPGSHSGNSSIYCKKCSRVKSSSYLRRWRVEKKQKIQNQVIRIIGVADHVKNQEERNLLRICYFDSVFNSDDFCHSLDCFEGLLFEQQARRFAVKYGEIVEVQ